MLCCSFLINPRLTTYLFIINKPQTHNLQNQYKPCKSVLSDE